MERIHQKLAIIWLVFTLLFSGLALCHWHLSRSKISDFQVRLRPMSQNTRIVAMGSDLDQPIKDFAADFNAYLNKQNSSSRFQNLLAMSGYVLAAITALISFTLELRQSGPTDDDICGDARGENHPKQRFPLIP
jgi:hypothetical protein